MSKYKQLITLKSGKSSDFVRALFYCRQVKELKLEISDLKKELICIDSAIKERDKEIRELKNLLSNDPNKIIIVKYKNIVKGMESKIVKYKRRISDLTIELKKSKNTNKELIRKYYNGKDPIL